MATTKLMKVRDLAITYDEFAEICIKAFNEAFDEFLNHESYPLIPTFVTKVYFEKNTIIENNYLSRFKTFLEECGGFNVKKICQLHIIANNENKYAIEITVGDSIF